MAAESSAGLQTLPPRRLVARLEAEVVRDGEHVRAKTLREHGGLRGRFLRRTGTELCIVNPCGGIVGGDRVDFSIRAGAGAGLTVTTPAPERLYRAGAGEIARIDLRLVAEHRSRLHWLPQETLVHDGAACTRTLAVDAAEDSDVMVCDVLVLGREAHGERLGSVFFRDHWRISRGGRLVYAEAVRLPAAAGRLHAPALAADRRGVGLLVHVTRGTDALERARAALGAEVRAGATLVDGVLVVRWLDAPERVVRHVGAFLQAYLGGKPPLGWQRSVSCN